MSNPIYEAALEGRYPISIEVTQKGNEYVAVWAQHGHSVKVTGSSQQDAMQEATRQVMDSLKNIQVFDTIYG